MAVLRINAGQLNRTNDKALAAKMSGIEVGDASNDLKAYCAGLRRSGKGPSKEQGAPLRSMSLVRSLGGGLSPPSQHERGVRL